MSIASAKSIPTWGEVTNLFKTWHLGMPGDSAYPATTAWIHEDNTPQLTTMHFIFEGVDDCRLFSEFHLGLVLLNGVNDKITFPNNGNLLYTPVYQCTSPNIDILIDTYENTTRIKFLLRITAFDVNKTLISTTFVTYRIDYEDRFISDGADLSICMYAK